MQTFADNSRVSLTEVDGRIECLFMATFGISSEQFKRELEAEFNRASPAEQAELERVVNEASAALPRLHATVDHGVEMLADIGVRIDALKESLEQMNARVVAIEEGLGKDCNTFL